MRDYAAELAAELAEHWRDPYWWADHPALRTFLLGLLAGVVGLAVKYAELRLVRAMTPGDPS